MGAQRAISPVEEPERLAPDLQLVVHNPPEPPEDAIRQRSLQIWEREGRPDGHADEHWARARAELAEQLARMANTQLAEPANAEDAAQPDAEYAVMPITVILPPEDGEETPDNTEEAAPEEAAASAPAVESEDRPLIAAEPLPTAVTEPDDRIPAAVWLQNLTPHAPSTAPSIVCGGLVLKGDLECPGDLHFEGNLEGSIRSPSLDVGTQARVVGEVVARDLTVRGTIHGRIVAERLLLCAGAHLQGEIVYRTLTIETGAQLNADFRRAG